MISSVPGQCLNVTPFPLCRKHVVFGKVVEGLDIVKRVEELPVDGKDRPLTPVVIKDCGEVKAAAAKTEEPARGTVSILWPCTLWDKRWTNLRQTFWTHFWEKLRTHLWE
jgi:hypothetical protein